MINLLIALAVGGAGFVGLWLPGLLKAYEASAPAILVAMLAYFLLARRTFKAAEKLFTTAGGALQTNPPKFEKAIGILKQGYKFKMWQFGIAAQVDAQIGMILFLKKDFGDAQTYLKRALNWGHWMAAAMLAVVHYKKKQYDQMKEVMDLTVKKGKKESLAWNLYAYLLSQTGQRDRAMEILSRGLKTLKDNDKIKQNLLALQNGKKMKMRQQYNEQWYQFHLDRPPVKMMASPFGGQSKKRRRPMG